MLGIHNDMKRELEAAKTHLGIAFGSKLCRAPELRLEVYASGAAPDFPGPTFGSSDGTHRPLENAAGQCNDCASSAAKEATLIPDERSVGRRQSQQKSEFRRTTEPYRVTPTQFSVGVEDWR